METDLGVLLAKAGEPSWQEVLGDGHARAHGEVGRPFTAESLGHLEKPGRITEDRARPMREYPPVRGERGPCGPTYEQRGPDPALEILDHPARVGLGNARGAGGRAQAAMVIDSGEEFQDDEVGPPTGHAEIICRKRGAYGFDMS